MSIVKKAAKLSLVLFSALVLLFVAGSIYFYVNMGAIAKEISEKSATNALGVPVTIGDMDIDLDKKTVTVTDIKVANLPQYRKEHALTIKDITVVGESFSRDLLVFSNIKVTGAVVNLEVKPTGSNLGDIRAHTEKRYIGQEPIETEGQYYNPAKDLRVIVRHFNMDGTQIIPRTALVNKDFKTISVPNVSVDGVGEQENGLLAREAIAQIAIASIQQLNTASDAAGFFEGLPLETLNEMGVNTVDVFKKNLKKSYDKEVEKFKSGYQSLKKMFAEEFADDGEPEAQPQE